MDEHTNYWRRGKFSRRTVLQSAGVGVAGLAGAALIGCGSDDDGGGGGTPAAGGGTPRGQTGQTVQDATAVAQESLKLEPGIYEGPIGPSLAESDPAQYAKRGGVLKMRYLEPPRMDLNRTLSCTIYHTLNYTNNKLVRAIQGPNADPFLVEVEPDLAASWEPVDGGAEFIFNLHQGVKTHDVEPTNGREFTSEDVVAALEMYRAGGSQQDVYADVTDIQAPDAHTVVVKLNGPVPDFPTNVASWSFIYMKELVDDEDMRQEKAVGTGPFIQRQWIKDERSVFERHPDYFEEGLPYVDGIEVTSQDDPNALRSAFTTKNLFAFFGVRDDADMQDLFNQNQDTFVGTKYPISRGANVNGFQFQMKNPIFQDERIRRAFSLAFDRTEYDLARNAGDNENPEGPFSNGPMPWPLMFDAYPTMTANGQWYQFDPEQAAQLMEAAGYTADSPLEVELASYYFRNELGELVAPGIMQALPAVRINFRQVDNPTHVTMMSDRSFQDMVGFLWGPAGYSMTQWIYPFYHSSGGTNYGSINDSELDQLLDQEKAEADATARREIWQQVWDRIHDQVYQAWFPEAFNRMCWHNWLMNQREHGWTGSYVCYSSDQARNMWLEEGAPGVSR